MKKLFVVSLLILFIFLVTGCDDVDKLKKEAQKACNNDGIVQAPELCDDKNSVSADTCDQCFPTYCGDNQISNNPFNFNATKEQCDNQDQALADKQCADNGFNAPCNKNTCQCSGIAPPKKLQCNQNNIIDAGEECDKGPKGDSSCTPDCALTYCGDEKVQAPNGKDLNNKLPGFNEACDAGKNPFDINDPVAKNAHAFCQAVLGDPLAACVGCSCRAPPWSCADGSLAAFFGPVGPLPPGAVCQDDCAANLPNWKCDVVTCSCKPPPPPPEPTCVDNTLNRIFLGLALPDLPKVCKDDCKSIPFASADVFCDQTDCTCKPKDPPATCASNTFSVSFGGDASWKAGNACKDDCAELAKAWGGKADDVYCDAEACVCRPKGDGDEYYTSCSGNEELALSTGTILKPTAEKQCRNDCPSGEWCSEDCVCQPSRVVTPRCGDGYISSPFVPGSGNEECDTGGKYNPPTKDTCPEGKVCSMADPACKCVAISEIIPDSCPQGTTSNAACYNQCYPNQACEVVSYTKRTETPCYACNQKCPPGFFLNAASCQLYYGMQCAPVMRGCFGPVEQDGGDLVDGGTLISTGQEDLITVGGGSGTSESEPNPLNCQTECSQRGMSTSAPNFGSYILSYLNQYSCVSGASVQMPNNLRLRGPAGDECLCYSTQNPSVNIDQTPPVCQSS